jgi:hypothetical protein
MVLLKHACQQPYPTGWPHKQPTRLVGPLPATILSQTPSFIPFSKRVQKTQGTHGKPPFRLSMLEPSKRETGIRGPCSGSDRNGGYFCKQFNEKAAELSYLPQGETILRKRTTHVKIVLFELLFDNFKYQKDHCRSQTLFYIAIPGEFAGWSCHVSITTPR